MSLEDQSIPTNPEELIKQSLPNLSFFELIDLANQRMSSDLESEGSSGNENLTDAVLDELVSRNPKEALEN